MPLALFLVRRCCSLVVSLCSGGGAAANSCLSFSTRYTFSIWIILLTRRLRGGEFSLVIFDTRGLRGGFVFKLSCFILLLFMLPFSFGDLLSVLGCLFPLGRETGVAFALFIYVFCYKFPS